MLDKSTLNNYKELFKVIKPHLPNIELRQVRTPHIDKLLRDVVAADDANGGRRAHCCYVNMKNSFLSSAFRNAIRHGLVEVNSVCFAAIPERKEADTHAYTLEEFHAMIKGCLGLLIATITCFAQTYAVTFVLPVL